MITCSFCPNQATMSIHGSPLCDECRAKVCFLCTEIQKKVVFTTECASHEIGVTFKGNRFMQDKAFMSGGPFEFEPQ